MVNQPNAYEGNAPYIFISYAHKNTDRVLPIIAALQSRGFRVWYDAGIEAGSEWPEYIAQHLKNCGCFVAFITEEALESQNCRREINYAISKNLPMLAVYLAEVSLTPGMEMQLGTLQSLFAHRHDSMDSFVDKLSVCTLLRSCKCSENEAKGDRVISTESAEDLYEIGMVKERTKDYAAAAYFYRKAAEKGHVNAMLQLAELYKYGYGVEASDEEMAKWYLRAAEKGDPEAQFQLALHYNDTHRYSDALHWFQRAADQEHSLAYGFLGALYMDESAGEKNPETALIWYKKSMDSGDDLANMSRGFFISILRDFLNKGNKAYNEQDYAEAVRCYRIGVQYGDAGAQHGLANCYFHGRGVQKDIAEAIQLDLLAANQNLAAAQNAVGYYYDKGVGVSKNPDKAFAWYQKAALQGYARAQNNLGQLYYSGPRNYEEAVKWFRKAAESNYPAAQTNLGICYEWGLGVAKDLNEAIRWYDKAASQGNATARESAARCRESIKKIGRPSWFPF